MAVSMLAGAVYDIVFAAAILFFPRPAARILSLELPADPVYLELNGIFLLILAGMYLLPVLDPRRYRGVVRIAAGGRFLGFLFLGTAGWSDREPAFLVLAMGDLLFALLHLLLLRRALAEEAQINESKGS